MADFGISTPTDTSPNWLAGGNDSLNGGLGGNSKAIVGATGRAVLSAATSGAVLSTIGLVTTIPATAVGISNVYTINVANSKFWVLTPPLSANATLTINGAIGGYTGRITVQQNPTGGFSLTPTISGSFKTPNGAGILISQNPNAISTVSYDNDGTYTYVYANATNWA